MADDLYPAYIALIRRELKLSSGCDALVELDARLTTDDPASKPPSRAPGITRLRRALRRLEQRKSPADAPDVFAEDLRFLQLFSPDEPTMSPDAMRRLLDDVLDRTPSAPKDPDAPRVVPMPRAGKKRSGS